jgi:hypothetical protein
MRFFVSQQFSADFVTCCSAVTHTSATVTWLVFIFFSFDFVVSDVNAVTLARDVVVFVVIVVVVVIKIIKC